MGNMIDDCSFDPSVEFLQDKRGQRGHGRDYRNCIMVVRLGTDVGHDMVVEVGTDVVLQ